MSRAPVLQKTMRAILDEGPGAVVTKARRLSVFMADLAVAIWRLRTEAKRRRDLSESLEFAFRFSVGAVSIAPAQVREEIEALLTLLEADSPRGVLEIGTARGGTLYLLSCVAQADARLASIDLPGGDFGGGSGRLWVPLLKVLPKKGQKLKLLRADSHDSSTLEEVREWFRGATLDCLLIDGDHHFEGVHRDFLMYGPLVRPGGVIALHDIVPGREDRVGDVPRFWELIKTVYPTRELVHDWNQGGFGIGVVDVPPDGINAAVSLIDRLARSDSGEVEAPS
jgi:cephalosporin hydroxylase